jgi:hypothetical protein
MVDIHEWQDYNRRVQCSTAALTNQARPHVRRFHCALA